MIVKGKTSWKERILEFARLREPPKYVIPSLPPFPGVQVLFVVAGGTAHDIICAAKGPTVIWALPQTMGNARYAMVSAASAYGVLKSRGIPVKLFCGIENLQQKIDEVRAWRTR